MARLFAMFRTWLSDTRIADTIARLLEVHFAVDWEHYRRTGFGRIWIRWDGKYAELCSSGISSFPRAVTGEVRLPLLQELKISELTDSHLKVAAQIIEDVGEGMLRAGKAVHEGLVIEGSASMGGAKYICLAREIVKVSDQAVTLFELVHYCE